MRAHTFTVFCFFILYSISACAQEVTEDREWVPEDTEFYEPVPPVVEAQPAFLEPPSDAIVLFDGSDFSNWKMLNGEEEVEWIIEDGAMTVTPRSGDIVTRDGFGDIQLYLEWRTPAEIDGDGQGTRQ
jgi:hypothetical protein